MLQKSLFHKKVCFDVYELSTSMNKWSRVGGDSSLRLSVRPNHPCFFYHGKLFILSTRSEIFMFDCDTGENKEIRIASACDDVKRVLEQHAISCTTMHKHLALITSYTVHETRSRCILVLDLKRLNALFEDIPARSEMKGLASEVDLGDILSTRKPSVHGSSDEGISVLAMTVFGADLVAVARVEYNDVFVFGCDADQLCFDATTPTTWKRMYQLRFRHMTEDIRVKNIKRIRLHTLVANMA